MGSGSASPGSAAAWSSGGSRCRWRRRPSWSSGCTPPALGVFVAALATATGPLVRWLSRPIMLRAGEASYCLYLTHYLLRDVVAGLSDWGRQSWLAAIPATVAIVLALGGAAYALHRLVEVPARRLLHARAS